MSALNNMIGHGLGLASPVLVGAIATLGRRRRGLALGVVHPRHPGRRSSRIARVLHPGAAPRAVREGGRARRGDRGRATRRRSRWRPRSPGSSRSARSAPCSSRSARSASACSASRSLASLYLDDTLARRRASSSGACILSLSGIARAAAPAVRRRATSTATYRAGPGQGARAGRRADPAVGAVHAAAVLDAQRRAVRRSSSIPQAVLTTSRVRDGRAGAAGRRARTGCAAWAPRCRRCTSSSSAASCGGLIVGLPHRRDRRARHRDRPRRVPTRDHRRRCC